ncbi:TetR/AcrR family transcriptional regulator [Kineosporia sp. NBRC 101731]|uniref:TetR/AcrR family transcriptional regulator n=1 Tax=Kineosporia sp. NBRC 101731 TaxID=3032199 RepID=UPI0024A13F7F|nr:TetR/AcrR family transcriptional regulator [Kineosporia sp. NBRC 101731]GLY29186.1 TetR family transcriptional regulator [Kineosporia sp. NBRC 101731]
MDDGTGIRTNSGRRSPPSGPSPRTRPRGDQARARLLAAALQSFVANGFHGTGTRDIAEAAGMSPAAVYVHYSSKEELLFALSLAGHQEALDLVTGADEPHREPAQRLWSVVNAFCEWHAANHVNARLVQYELGSLTPEHAEVIAGVRRQISGTVRAILAEGVQAGVFQIRDLNLMVVALMSLSIDIARWYRSDGEWTPATIGRHHADIALSMVGLIDSAPENS